MSCALQEAAWSGAAKPPNRPHFGQRRADHLQGQAEENRRDPDLAMCG
jgi:hypothetical protein